MLHVFGVTEPDKRVSGGQGLAGAHARIACGDFGPGNLLYTSELHGTDLSPPGSSFPSHVAVNSHRHQFFKGLKVVHTQLIFPGKVKKKKNSKRNYAVLPISGQAIRASGFWIFSRFSNISGFFPFSPSPPPPPL